MPEERESTICGIEKRWERSQKPILGVGHYKTMARRKSREIMAGRCYRKRVWEIQ